MNGQLHPLATIPPGKKAPKQILINVTAFMDTPDPVRLHYTTSLFIVFLKYINS
jgi:hypothetical protein